MSIGSDFQKMPLAVKGIVYLAGGFAIYKGVKYVMKKVNPPPGQETINLAKTEAEQILKNNQVLPPEQQVKATFSPSQMKTFADTLETAMSGAGTDEDAVNDVFKGMQNDLDILLLIDSFGMRDDENLAGWLGGDGMTKPVNKLLETKSSISKRF